MSVHVIFFLVTYGTLCNARQLTRLIHVRGIDIDKDNFNSFDGTTTLACDCALLFIPMIVHWIFKTHRKFKSRNAHILPLPEPPKVSLFNQRVLQAGQNSRQPTPTKDYLDFNEQALMKSCQVKRNNWFKSQDTRKITRSFSFDELQSRKCNDLAEMFKKRPKTSTLYKKQDPIKSLKIDSADKHLQRDKINLKSNKLKSKQISPQNLRLSVRQLESSVTAEPSSNIKTLSNIIPLTYGENIMEDKDKKSSIRLNMTLIMVTLLSVVTLVAVYNSLFAFVTQILVDLLCFVLPVSYFFNNLEIIKYTERKLVRAYKDTFNQF